MKKDDYGYYLEVGDVVDNSFYSESDLGRVFNDNVAKTIKLLSRDIYALMYSYYKGVYMNEHKEFIQHRIELEKEQFKRAVIEHIKGAIESGMDLNAYIDQPKERYPRTVYTELRIGNLLDASRKIL
jgi:hypothetical protein